MAKLEDLSGIAITLLLTGVFFIIALVILGSMQTATVQEATGTTTVTWNAIGTQFPIANLVSVTSITNGTVTLGRGNYTVTPYSGVKDANGVITVAANVTGVALCTQGGGSDKCYVTYVYDNFDSSASVVVDSAVTATTEIPSNWLLLIAVIVAASIVIGIVINNLGREGR
jgi:hypothetical protein